MAERSQYQYQTLTGPVWREPVAERLAWLPRVQQPARGLPRGILGDFTQPLFFEEPAFDPQNLEWIPVSRYAGRSLPPHPLLDWTVLPLPQPAFDPQTLDWLFYAPPLHRSLPPHRLGWFSQPDFETLYRPEGLQWLTPSLYYPRSVAHYKSGAFTIDPLPPAAVAAVERLRMLRGMGL